MSTVEHRIASAELVGTLTMQVRYTCTCGWFGPYWNGHAEETGATPLPPDPPRPPTSRRDLHIALYGNQHRCARCR